MPTGERAALQEAIGEYESLSGLSTETYLFQGHPKPAWISRPIGVGYERWGESLERWTISNSWRSEGLEDPQHQEKRVIELLPKLHEPERLTLWGLFSGLTLCVQDGRLLLLYIHRDGVSIMPEGRVHVTDPRRVLFSIPAPTLSMSRAEWMRTEEPTRLGSSRPRTIQGSTDSIQPSITAARGRAVRV